ncbi:protein FAM222B [Syngnathus acus]|uniref:protein FAM222B n=1 Tax=Syngnathus acus TaxID=161584 RepID=UPI001885D367|nr:protein FAM222B [Syngnathus acus]XP_037126444.1 protein FAM222B [Syngnathus acus]
MLACLPGPGDLPLQLLPHTQMNTGLQKWDTTQRMRSTPFPTPAELDAYAKKVANNPLTIKIFPNSIKVPQRNHVRRTVNGLDTSGQRYSPYPSSQAKTGLLAIVKVPSVKGILKDFAGGRSRLHPEVIMNHLRSPYQVTSTSTLNPRHSTLPNLPQPQQSLALQAQDAPQTLQMPLAQQQSLRHALPVAQHSQGPPRLQTVSQHPALGHPSAVLLQQQQQQQQHLQQQQQQQQPPPGLQGSRKLPDGDAPPNVTVSTSTIPLPMATGLHQGHQPDLSTIVHQINQFCQARAQGAGSASMCEGQIANPSPISRNLLISACSRVSMHSNPAAAAGGFHPHNCILGPQENSAIPAGAHPLPSVTMNHLPSNHTDLKQQQHPQQHLHPKPNQQLQQANTQQQKMRSWNPQHLTHVPHIPNGCKQPTRDAGFHLTYPVADMCVGHPYMLKPPIERPTPSPPVNHNGMTVAHYPNGHYFQSHIWNSNILPTPNSDSSGSQDLAMPFHGAGPGGCGALECGPPGAPHYRLPASSSTSSAQTNLMQTTDYMGGDFQTPYFRDQNLGLMGKMHRPPMSRVGPELGDGRSALIQHPGYR